MVPVACGLLSKDFVKDLKDDGTYSPLTFAREYESKWGGDSAESFFSGIEFDKNRIFKTGIDYLKIIKYILYIIGLSLLGYIIYRVTKLKNKKNNQI